MAGGRGKGKGSDEDLEVWVDRSGYDTLENVMVCMQWTSGKHKVVDFSSIHYIHTNLICTRCTLLPTLRPRYTTRMVDFRIERHRPSPNATLCFVSLCLCQQHVRVPREFRSQYSASRFKLFNKRPNTLFKRQNRLVIHLIQSNTKARLERHPVQLPPAKYSSKYKNVVV